MSRRSPGEGSIYRRCAAKGCGRTIKGKAKSCAHCGSRQHRWSYEVRLRGKRYRKSGFKSAKDARNDLQALKQRHATGRVVEPSKLTVGSYLDRWLEAMRGEYTPSTWDTAEVHVRRYIKPQLGDVRLQDLTATDVKAALATIAKDGRTRSDHPLSRKTVHNVYRTLSRALNDAVEDNLIVRNPAARAHRMPDSPEQTTWTDDQLRQLFAHEASDRWLPLWTFIGDSGVRRGEAAGLRWSDLDLDAGRANLNHGHTKGQGGAIVCGRLKGKRGRTVDLAEPTMAALRDWRKQQAADKLAWPGEWGNDEDLVFTHEDGRPLHPDSITKLFQRRVRRVSKWDDSWGERCPTCQRKREDHSLPMMGPHGLRHTWATLALAAGVPLKVVQERYGHASIAITGDIYSHVAPGMQAEAAAKVAGLINGQGAAGGS